MYRAELLSHELYTDDHRLANLLDQMSFPDGATMKGPATQAYHAEYRVLHETVIAALSELSIEPGDRAMVIHRNCRVQVWPGGDRDPSTVRKLPYG